MTDPSILNALCGLLPGEFDRVLGEIGVPFEILSGPQAPQATRAVELIRWAKQREDRFRALVRMLDVNGPHAHSPAPNAPAKKQRLEHDRVLDLLRAATDARLDRNTLLQGIDPSTVAGLPSAPSPADQILCDLSALNHMGTLLDGSYPLRIWLQNAVTRAGQKSEALVFREALAEIGDAGRQSR